jgi:maleylacetate reductase
MATATLEFALRIAPMRLRFGAVAAHAVAEELAAIGARRAVLISTPGQEAAARLLAAEVGAGIVGCLPLARMHTPVPETEAALSAVTSMAADGLVALGGGSAVGLSKAIALRTDLPQIVIPTTYAGSEATAILGQTNDGRKTTITDARVQPEVIIYDPRLITSLPPATSATSGMNALAHAAEALYARDRNPLTTVLALEGARAMVQSLPLVIENPGDLAARAHSQYGAFLCGLVLGQVGMSLHHKLCHVLGGSFDLPHAETHAVILPYALAYNQNGGKVPAAAMQAFCQSVGTPGSLCELGMPKDALERAADMAAQNPYWNPETLTRDGLLALLQSAWEGRNLQQG